LKRHVLGAAKETETEPGSVVVGVGVIVDGC